VVRARPQLSRDPLGSPGESSHEKSFLVGAQPLRCRAFVASCRSERGSAGRWRARARGPVSPLTLRGAYMAPGRGTVSSGSRRSALSVVHHPALPRGQRGPVAGHLRRGAVVGLVEEKAYRGQVSAGRGTVRPAPPARARGARRGSVAPYATALPVSAPHRRPLTSGTPRLRPGGFGGQAAGGAVGLIARRWGLPNKALQLTAGVRGVRGRLPAAAGCGAGRADGGRTVVRWGTAGGS
jgi:hypothetical protein